MDYDILYYLDSLVANISVFEHDPSHIIVSYLRRCIIRHQDIYHVGLKFPVQVLMSANKVQDDAVVYRQTEFSQKFDSIEHSS